MHILTPCLFVCFLRPRVSFFSSVQLFLSQLNLSDAWLRSQLSRLLQASCVGLPTHKLHHKHTFKYRTLKEHIDIYLIHMHSYIYRHTDYVLTVHTNLSAGATEHLWCLRRHAGGADPSTTQTIFIQPLFIYSTL